MGPSTVEAVYTYTLREAQTRGHQSARGELQVNILQSYEQIGSRIHLSGKSVRRAIDHLTEKKVYSFRDKLFLRFHPDHAELIQVAMGSEQVADLFLPTRSGKMGKERPDGSMSREEWEQIMSNIAAFSANAQDTLRCVIYEHRKMYSARGKQPLF